MKHIENGVEYAALPESLVLVRHGESESNLAKSLQEQGNPMPRERDLMGVHTSFRRLTPLGLKQAEQAGAWLRLHWIDRTLDPKDYRYFVSDYIRAMETAGCLGINGRWQTDSRIVERNWGDLDQILYAERMEQFARELEARKERAFFWRPTNGETFQDVTNRLNLMKERIRRSPASHVIMVCHGETMWVWRKLLERLTAHELRDAMLNQNDQTSIHNCRIIEYSRRDADGTLQPSLTRVRLIDPSCPTNPETNLDWMNIDRKYWSDEDLIDYADTFECFLEEEAVG